jgi:hypothetical protein
MAHDSSVLAQLWHSEKANGDPARAPAQTDSDPVVWRGLREHKCAIFESVLISVFEYSGSKLDDVCSVEKAPSVVCLKELNHIEESRETPVEVNLVGYRTLECERNQLYVLLCEERLSEGIVDDACNSIDTIVPFEEADKVFLVKPHAAHRTVDVILGQAQVLSSLNCVFPSMIKIELPKRQCTSC